MVLKSVKKHIDEKPTAHDDKATFSIHIPLKRNFGFCDDYNNIVYDIKHQLTLIPKTSDETFVAFFIRRNNTAVAGKTATDTMLRIRPHVTIVPTQIRAVQNIKSKSEFAVMYRSRQCDTIAAKQSTICT